MHSKLLAFPILALLAGCEKAVEVVAPNTYNFTPVREVTVKFSKNFKPGSFTAKLDGQDITGLFVPAPAPNGYSTAQLPADDCGFITGEGPPSSPPPQRPPVRVENRPAEGSPSSGAVYPQVPTGSGSGSTAPIPQPPAGLTVYWHRVVVNGSCKTPLICEGDERQFLPLHLVGVPSMLSIVGSAVERFEIETWPKATAEIPVRVSRQTQSVTYNGGSSASTVVPAGGRSAPIAVAAAVPPPSSHVTFLCSPGVQRGAVKGDVR